ncbi:hypothetical protein [Novosphingobium sp. CCH12-A3]|nr:hypothetical protein [Novosphingobium sp. CCH12-A3]
MGKGLAAIDAARNLHLRAALSRLRKSLILPVFAKAKEGANPKD